MKATFKGAMIALAAISCDALQLDAQVDLGLEKHKIEDSMFMQEYEPH